MATKHERKLKKKAGRIKRQIIRHPGYVGWQGVRYKIRSNKIKLAVFTFNAVGDPWEKEVVLGLKDELNFTRFLGKFGGQ